MVPTYLLSDKKLFELNLPIIFTEYKDENGTSIYVPEEEPKLEDVSCFLKGLSNVYEVSILTLKKDFVLQIKGNNKRDIVRLINLSTNYSVDIPDVEFFSIQSVNWGTFFLESSDNTVIYYPALYAEAIHYPGLYMNQTMENRLLDYPLHLKALCGQFFIFVTHKETGEIQAHFDFSCKKWVFWCLYDEKSINIENITAKTLSENGHLVFVDPKNFIIYNGEGKKIN